MKILIIVFGVFIMACNQTQQQVVTNDHKQSHSAVKISETVSNDSVPKIVKSEAEWKSILSKEEFYVLREKGTERSFTGDLLNNKATGTYVCAACQFPLFKSDTKFKSGTGWPSFWQPIKETHITEETDTAYGMRRVEVLCASCDGHLGHVFDDGPQPTGLRYCINSVSLDFVEKK